MRAAGTVSLQRGEPQRGGSRTTLTASSGWGHVLPYRCSLHLHLHLLLLLLKTDVGIRVLLLLQPHMDPAGSLVLRL